jgi:type 1 fimbria pilin
MLKRMLVSTAALALFALPLRAQAAAAGGGDQVTLTGQVIDVNCYSTHQLSGAQHKTCATACANKGVSLAILATDGTIYMPVSSKPADPQNSRLVSFAEGKVKVTGTHRMANGLHTIEIATVEAAS